jgi:ketosteroid isomerase-like protein
MLALMEMMSDEITFVIPGKSMQSGTLSGKEEVRRYFSIIGVHTEGTHRVEPFDVLANDVRAVVLVRVSRLADRPVVRHDRGACLAAVGGEAGEPVAVPRRPVGL